jgi:hypothetical protein
MKALRWTMPKAAEPLKPNQRYLKFYRFPRCGPDEVLGPIVMRVASFLPFQTSDYLNGHSFIEQELKRARSGLRKTDNAFLAVERSRQRPRTMPRPDGVAGADRALGLDRFCGRRARCLVR